MSLRTARDLKQDILFRAGENIAGASEWNVKVVDYLNRAYRSLANGASEFLPDSIDDWWWMRGTGVLSLLPVFETGSVTLTEGSIDGVLSLPPAYSLVGWRLRVRDYADVPIISTHVAAAITLDSAWTGDSGTFSFRAMKVQYALSTSVVSLMSPMQSFHGRGIIGMTPERMDHLFSVTRIDGGVPYAFCLTDPQTVRFSHGGLTTGKSMRVEYKFKPSVVDLEDSDTSIPLVPQEFRHLLSDMALMFLATDKNDDRAIVYAGNAKAGLMSMVKENKRQLSKIDTELGTIRPRQSTWIGPYKLTDSGRVIQI